MSFDWDKVSIGKDLPPWVEWSVVGAKFIGTITDFREHTFPARGDQDARTVTVIDCIEWGTNEPKSLSLGPIDLRAKMKEAAPQKRDMVKVEYVGDEKVENAASKMKVFAVEVKKAEPITDPFESAPPTDSPPELDEFDSAPF